MAEEQLSYRDQVAQELVASIEAGTAPWQKPWKPGTIPTSPFNPTTGKPYRGWNTLWLSMQGHSDPRWMTYRQSSEIGAQVRKGERSTRVEYWQLYDQVLRTDDAGKPVLGADGNKQYYSVELERPRRFHAAVFNAEQIDGLEPLVVPAPTFDPVERAEAILAGGGVPITHDQNDRAFYSPFHDHIHLPPPAHFKDATGYYETALHELGHATGHTSRLDRFFGPHGSEGYAREELRAEIASFMLARDLGVGFDPGNHAAYVESWLKHLKANKNEIFLASRDAETIKTWVMEPERRPELERAAQTRKPTEQTEKQAMTEKPAALEAKPEGGVPTRVFLAVPFTEKNEAKAAGAKWSKQDKSWWISADADRAPFAKWIAGAAAAKPAEVSPEKEFGDFLKAHGLAVEGKPEMDGKWHRVAVEGDHDGKKSGSYIGYLPDKNKENDRAAGLVTNWKAGHQGVKWVHAGAALTPEQRADLAAQAAQTMAQRAADREQAAKIAARKAYGVWTNLPDGATPEACPYLAAKGVQGHGVKVAKDGHLVVPQRDGTGRLWGVQFCSAEGKRYMKGNLHTGTMHVIEPTGKGTLDAITPAMGGTIVIAEGYATAATIFEATGRPVVVAFDSGNLRAVAEAVRAAHPERELVIAGDNDHANKLGNVGAKKAEEAAQAVGAIWTVPKLSEKEKAAGLTDFNDIGRSQGKAAVRHAIDAALNRGRGDDLARGIA